MARVLAFDIGLKRTGVAVTDPLQIIATPLEYVQTNDIFNFINNYLKKEEVEVMVIGEPKNLDGGLTDSSKKVREISQKMRIKYPDQKIVLIDERFTSKMALSAMIRGGSKKKDRRKKGNIDKISAAIILQSYLEQKGNQ